MRYVALLRGINVGGNKLVRMARLREVIEGLGCTGVATLLQSGNAVFTSTLAKPAVVERRLERAIAEAFGFDVPVLVRTRDELADIIARNPFAVRDPAKLLVIFMSKAAAPTLLAALVVRPPEALRARGRELYVHLPNGIGTSKLAAALMKPRNDVVLTGRNWATLQKLKALLDA